MALTEMRLRTEGQSISRKQNVLDDYTLECQCRAVVFSIGGNRVARLLTELEQQQHGPEQRVVCDNGRKLELNAPGPSDRVAFSLWETTSYAALGGHLFRSRLRLRA